MTTFMQEVVEAYRVEAALNRLDFLLWQRERPIPDWGWPEIDWPTWRVRERPFDFERDG